MDTNEMPPTGDTPTPDPAADETNPTAWIASDEPQRAKQLETAATMMETEGLTLKWKTTADLKQLGLDNHAAIMAKQSVAAKGGGQAAALRAIDARIRVVVPELRNLMQKKFKADYASYYEEFGFVRSGKNWELPDDRDLRADKIEELLLPALTTHGMQADADTGLSIWTAISTDLNTALGRSIGTKRERATHVAATTPQGAEVLLALQCIVMLVKANYPQAPEKMLRAFGFLKESN